MAAEYATLGRMRPFLLIATRDEPAAAGELAAVLRATGLAPDQLVHLRLDQAPLPDDFRLDDYSGVFLGGSPFNASDPIEQKSVTQLRVEADLDRLFDEVIARDFPFFGLCYGVGALGRHQGGVINNDYAEKVGPVTVTLTPEASEDQLAQVMPPSFEAFVGHKEAVAQLPANAVLLATGEVAPHQFFRIGRNVYATQFHPELNATELMARVALYHGHGYFEPHEVDQIHQQAHAADVSQAPWLLQRFVEVYRN